VKCAVATRRPERCADANSGCRRSLRFAPNAKAGDEGKPLYFL
jgi:hypothetical protein